jgi:hypothetical protein
VMFRKLLTQVEADHIEFSNVTHVPCVHPSGIMCSNSQEYMVSTVEKSWG